MRGQKINICADCGADISHRGNRSFRCKPCQGIVDKAIQHQFKVDQRTKIGTAHFCEDCGKFLGECHYNRQYCDDCEHERRLESQKKSYAKNKKKVQRKHRRYYRKHHKRILAERQLKYRIYHPDDVRICIRCGDGFNDRPSHAVMCLKCSEIRKKERMAQWQYENRERERQEDPYIERILVFPICIDCEEIIEGRGHGSRRCIPCHAKHEKERAQNWKDAHPESVKATWRKHFKRKVKKREKIRDHIHEVNMDGLLIKVDPRKKYGKRMGYQLIEEYPSRMLSKTEVEVPVVTKHQPIPMFSDINYL